jgi:membrane protein
MAAIRDFLPVMRSQGPVRFFHRVWEQVLEDNILTWASALAYSWLFAIFPFLIFLLSLVTYLPEQAKLSSHHVIKEFVDDTMPARAADVFTAFLKTAVLDRHPAGGLLSVGLLFMLWAASRGMSMTMLALDQCYDQRVGRPFWKQAPISVGLTIVVAALVISLFVLLPLGAAVTDWMQMRGTLREAWAIVLTVARHALALLLMLAILAIVYYFGPSIRQRFQLVSPGAVFSIIVWAGLAEGFRLYVDRFGKYDQTYGTVGGVAILLLFFYIDAVVLLVGAEINSEIDFAVLGVPEGTRDFTGPRKLIEAERAAKAGNSPTTATPPAAPTHELSDS